MRKRRVASRGSIAGRGEFPLFSARPAWPDKPLNLRPCWICAISAGGFHPVARAGGFGWLRSGRQMAGPGRAAAGRHDIGWTMH